MSFWSYRDDVFDYVARQLEAYRTDLSVGSMLEPDPASFPACFVYEIGNRRIQNYINTDYTDEQCESTFEVQVVSNALAGAKSEAEAIMDAADAAMNECGYIRDFRKPIDNIDRRAYRIVSRYRRLITGTDTIPTFAKENNNVE